MAENRVIETFGELGLAVFVQQTHVLQFNLLPQPSIGLIQRKILLKCADSFGDALVIEGYSLNARCIIAFPISLFKPLFCAFGDGAKNSEMAVKAA